MIYMLYFLFQRDNGGLVMISFYNLFLTCSETASIQDVVGKFNNILSETQTITFWNFKKL